MHVRDHRVHSSAHAAPQVLFSDGSELLLRAAEEEVDYLPPRGTRVTLTLRAIRAAGPSHSVGRRLTYALKLLESSSA
jgi:hypothetical protein